MGEIGSAGDTCQDAASQWCGVAASPKTYEVSEPSLETRREKQAQGFDHKDRFCHADKWRRRFSDFVTSTETF